MEMHLNLTIDLSNAQQVKALNTFTESLNLSSIQAPKEIHVLKAAVHETEEPADAPTPAPKRTRTAKKVEDIEVKDAEELPTAPPAVAEEPAEPADEKSISITDIRSMLSKKVGDFREEIKAELERLGAKNVTSLNESSYNDFFDFLTAL